nr:unnamed protein product [Callosobruchus chinensis]
MEPRALLCILSLAVAKGGCYPITDKTTAKSDSVQVLPQSRANESPLSGVQNFFSNMNFLNGSNPFSQLFSSNNNLLNDVHVFLVANQGLIFPASTFFKGFDFIKGMGNILQKIPIKLPIIGGNTN